MRLNNKIGLMVSLVLGSMYITVSNAEDKSSEPKAEMKKIILPALQRYVFKDETRVKALVGLGVQNRFQIKGSKIHELIGQGFLYKIVSDESGTHVFVTPSGADKERIDLTLIYDDGKACDLTLITSNDRISRSVLLIPEADSLPAIENDLIACDERKEEIQQMLKAMLKDRRGKYYREVLLKRLPDLAIEEKYLELVIDRRYNWAAAAVKGLRVRVRNTSPYEVTINEQLIRSAFENAEVVYLPRVKLASGEQVVVFVIRRDNRFGQNGERY